MRRPSLTRARVALTVGVAAFAIAATLAGSGAAGPSSYCGHGSNTYWTLVGPHKSEYQYGWSSGGTHYHKYNHLVWWAVVHDRTLACGGIGT